MKIPTRLFRPKERHVSRKISRRSDKLKSAQKQHPAEPCREKKIVHLMTSNAEQTLRDLHGMTTQQGIAPPETGVVSQLAFATSFISCNDQSLK